MSLVNVKAEEAEWRTRKINLFSLLRGFLTQVSPGQDLTKVSLPSVLLHPFSMLEVMSQRELLSFHLLFDLDKENDPLQRFFIVLRWFISLVRTETIEKKPYNPVIGEYHHAWVVNDENKDDVTEFISEQVSHHPPISATFTRAALHGLELTLNPTFGVKFGRNFAGVTTAGAAKLTTPKDTYELTKVVPDMIVHNVIKGKRYISWTGEITLTCPESGYTATIVTKDKDRVNLLNAHVSHINDLDKKLYELEGVCGDKSYITPAGGAKSLFFDNDAVNFPKIFYLPYEHRTDFESMEVWKKCSTAIIADDMKKADEEKKKVEADQRIREAKKKADGLMDEGTYFFKDKNSLEADWVFRDNLSLVKLLGGAKNMQTALPYGPNLKPVNRLHAAPPTTNGTPPVAALASSLSSDERLVDVPDDDEVPKASAEESIAAEYEIDETNEKSEPEIKEKVKRQRSSSVSEKAKTSREPSSPQLNAPRSASHSSAKLSGSRASLSTTGRVASYRELDDTESDDDLESSATSSSKLSKKDAERLRKAEKKELRKAKKEIMAKARENQKMLGSSNLIDSEQIRIMGMVKIRNPLKKWKTRYAVVMDGRVIAFKDKADFVRENAVAIINLKGTVVKHRPSKKEGYCLKIFNIHDFAIFSNQDLRGRSIPMKLGNPSYVLIRLLNPQDGVEWLRAVRKSIPDYEQNVKLMEKAGLKAEDSDESFTEDGEDEDEDDGVTSSTLTGTPTFLEKMLFLTEAAPAVSLSSMPGPVPRQSEAAKVGTPPQDTSPREIDVAPPRPTSPPPSATTTARIEKSAQHVRSPSVSNLSAKPQSAQKSPAERKKSAAATNASPSAVDVNAELAKIRADIERSVKAEVSAAEQRIVYAVKSAALQSKRLEAAAVGAAPGEKAKSKTNTAAAGAAVATPSVLLLLLALWWIWSLSSQLSSLQSTLDHPPPPSSPTEL